jgi:hypothetical protein
MIVLRTFPPKSTGKVEVREAA